MTNLRDILPNRGELTEMLDQGYVRQQVHPTEPLFILNYTEKAMWEHKWNDTTRTCRGLIINSETYEVVARPFAKFFNYGEISSLNDLVDLEDNIALTDIVTVTDKMDGSLGIKYWAPRAKQWCIATRGSFTSDQALHATAKLQELLTGEWAKNFEQYFTELYEIVYPENRIVLDYGQLDSLVYLACVAIDTGQVLPADEMEEDWAYSQGFGCTRIFGEMTFAEALAMPPRPNAEGIVVTNQAGTFLLKIKQEDYVRLHRIISGLSVKSVWEMMRDDLDKDDIKRDLPEEFWPWVDETYDELAAQFCSVRYGVQITHQQIMGEVTDFYHDKDSRTMRKEYAQRASKFPYKGLLFKMLDNRNVDDVVIKMIEPKGDQPRPFARGEDVA